MCQGSAVVKSDEKVQDNLEIHVGLKKRTVTLSPSCTILTLTVLRKTRNTLTVACTAKRDNTISIN